MNVDFFNRMQVMYEMDGECILMVRDLVHHVSSPLVGEQSSAGGFFLAETAGLEPATR